MTVKEYIQSLNMTQKQVAKLCGCSLRSVQYWIQKDRMPAVVTTLLNIIEKQKT